MDDDDDKSMKSDNSGEAEWQSWDCVLCGKMSDGYGNNPAPLASLRYGQCCDECNETKVKPARFDQMVSFARARAQQRMDEEVEMDEVSTVGVEESKEEDDGIIPGVNYSLDQYQDRSDEQFRVVSGPLEPTVGVEESKVVDG